jgi:SAM-dependent methyltransferase
LKNCWPDRHHISWAGRQLASSYPGSARRIVFLPISAAKQIIFPVPADIRLAGFQLFSMSYYRDQLEWWLKEIDVKVHRVLDIGGAANPVKPRVRYWKVDEYKILDRLIEPPQIGIPHYQGDIQEIDFGAFSLMEKALNKKETSEKFDIVFCLEVAEYFLEPLRVLKNIAGYLNDGGILYMSFPFVYPIHNPREYDCLRYTRYGIEKLLRMAGFEIEQLINREAHDGDKLIDFYKSDGMHIKADSTVTGYLVKAIKI